MATKTPAVTKTEMAGKTVLKRGERGKRGGTEGLRRDSGSFSLQASAAWLSPPARLGTCVRRTQRPTSETGESKREAGCDHVVKGPVSEATVILRRRQKRSGLSAVITLRSAAVSAKVMAWKPAAVRSVSISEVA